MGKTNVLGILCKIYCDMQDGMFRKSVSVSIGKSQKKTFGKGRALIKLGR